MGSATPFSGLWRTVVNWELLPAMKCAVKSENAYHYDYGDNYPQRILGAGEEHANGGRDIYAYDGALYYLLDANDEHDNDDRGYHANYAKRG